jgi:DNA-binding MarR family transcriptional regulator
VSASDSVEFEKYDALLRAGEIPDSWRPLLADADPSLLLIMMWAGRLARRIEAFYQQALRPHGLQYSDYTVLSILRLTGPLSPTNLNRTLAITAGGLTKSIDRLERGALVRRTPDPDDGRGTLVTLTAKGRRTAARVFAGDLEAHQEMFRNLSGAARGRVASALRELLDAFETTGERSEE